MSDAKSVIISNGNELSLHLKVLGRSPNASDVDAYFQKYTDGVLGEKESLYKGFLGFSGDEPGDKSIPINPRINEYNVRYKFTIECRQYPDHQNAYHFEASFEYISSNNSKIIWASQFIQNPYGGRSADVNLLLE